MPEGNQVKLDIKIDILDQYEEHGSGKYRKLIELSKAKIDDFKYKETVTIGDDDVTKDVIEKDLLRAGKSIFVAFSMGVDGEIKQVAKAKQIKATNEMGARAALMGDNGPKLKKIFEAEAAATNKSLTSLIKAILKEYSSAASGGGVDFDNLPQVERYCGELEALEDLRKDYDKFQKEATEAAKGADFGDMSAAFAAAYDRFVKSDGVKLVEAGRKIPKVTEDKKAASKDKAEFKKAEAKKAIGEALKTLAKDLSVVDKELDDFRAGYESLQATLEKAQKDKNNAAATKKVVEKAVAELPDIKLAAIAKVIRTAKQATVSLKAYKAADK